MKSKSSIFSVAKVALRFVALGRTAVLAGSLGNHGVVNGYSMLVEYLPLSVIIQFGAGPSSIPPPVSARRERLERHPRDHEDMVIV
jgi:hypothetical protein